MNIVQSVKQFMDSDIFEQLSNEASHNDNALELLEMVDISVASLLFFKQNKIKNRELLEAHNLNKLFDYIKEVYEQ